MPLRRELLLCLGVRSGSPEGEKGGGGEQRVLGAQQLQAPAAALPLPPGNLGLANILVAPAKYFRLINILTLPGVKPRPLW